MTLTLFGACSPSGSEVRSRQSSDPILLTALIHNMKAHG